MADRSSIPLSLAEVAPPRQPALSAGAVIPAGHAPVRSLYVHVPFCFHKCHYCDFYSFVDTLDQQAAFVARLQEELVALAPHAGRIETIFVGGGTPSLLRPELWRRVLSTLHDRFDLGGKGSVAPEFTVECNPETVTPELAMVLVEGGVNRASLGAQSFEPRHLKTLERWHDPATVEPALETVRRAGIRRTSLDLIYAIPGQTLAEWESDVRRAIALGVEHLSCYNLTYEKGTAMTVRLGRGEFTPTDEDLEADMFEMAASLTQAAGLERYEVSNYARTGQECRHNLVYWRQGQWLAAGPSASGHVGGARFKNVPHLPNYLTSAGLTSAGLTSAGLTSAGLTSAGRGYAPVIDAEAPDQRRAVRERFMTGLRLREGVPRGFAGEAERVAPGAGARLMRLAAELESDGLLVRDESVFRVTTRGWLLADFVARRFMQAVG